MAGIGNGNPVPEGITGLGFLRDLGPGTEIAIPVGAADLSPLKSPADEPFVSGIGYGQIWIRIRTWASRLITRLKTPRLNLLLVAAHFLTYADVLKLI